jgi:hypothetical protein
VTDIDTRLDAATTAVLAEVARTDGKAAGLLTAFSLPLAALMVALPSRMPTGLSAVLTTLGVVGLLAAMLTVLLVVRPYLRGRPRGSYLYWADCTVDEVLADLTAPTDRAAHVVRLSRLARRKYKGLQAAVDLTAAALVALVAALLVALI